MKKRLLSALLALALVFVLLPTTALAGVTTESDYDISINGKDWKFDTDDSGANIPVYYYANYTFNTDEGYGFHTNDNLMLTKEGNTVTISFRRGTGNTLYSNPVKFTIESKVEGSAISCIEMGNGNNLVITGEGTKGTLTLTRDGKGGIGAALSSKVGDITITGGATVNVTFKKQSTPNVSGHAISVDNHDLIISGEGTTVEATNQSGASRDFSNDATVKVKNGMIDISGGARLKATNEFSNTSKPYSSNFNDYSYFSCAISGDKDAPCTVSVTGENSCIIASAHNSTKYDVNTSMGQAYRWANFKVDGAKIEVGTSSPEQTITDINNIKNYKYAKISIPALQRTSDVLIAGENAVVGVETSIPSANGSGTYSYNESTHTLTLKDVNITSGINAIQFMANGVYTIKLEGENKISNVSRGILAKSANQNITGNINVILSGSGSLDISAKGRAIEVPSGNLTFNNTGAITLATTNTTVDDTNAINVSGNISIGDDFNRNLKITAGNDTFDLKYSDFNDLNKYKSITIAPKSSETYYNGTAMKYGETRTAGSGTISCDENGVITLNGATEGTLEFRSSADSTLVLEGTNTLSSIVTTQMGLTISGSGSLTVGSIKVHNQKTSSGDKPNLTITDGAHVTVGTAELTTRAIDIDGDLTVTGATLTATSNSDNVPTVQVGGNATFTGSTVTITNNSTALHNGAADNNEKGDSVSSALYVKGNINADNANVTAKVENGGGNAIGALGNITVKGSNVTAVNKGQKFTTIIAENVYISGESIITANNLNKNNIYGGSYLAFPAIEGNIVNQNTDYSLKFEGETNGTSAPTTLAPGEQATLSYYNVTITRGAEVTRTQSPVVIAGTTLLNDTYYTITNGSTVAEGTDSNYNAFYDSETKTLKLNKASINGAGTNKAIEANVGGNTLTIELVGNNIVKTSGFANNVIDITGNLYFTGSGTAEVSGKGTPIYATYKIDVSADVTITNTEKAGSFTFSAYGENSSNYKGANIFAIGTGYTAYATTDKTTWAVYDNTTASENESYTTLRITTQTLETGGGSTHQHTYDQSAWKSDATHHWQECTDLNCPDPTKGITNKDSHSFSNGTCTVCGYRGQTEEHHFGTEWIYDAEYHWHKCTDEGCTAISGKASHEWTGWKIDEPSSLGMHNRFCNCGYNDYGHLYNLVYAAAGEAGHYQYCTVGNCTFKTSTEQHNYDGDTCTICNYTKSGEIVPPTPDNPGTIVIIRPAEEEKPAQQPNPSTGANDLVGLAVAAAVAAALGSAALLRKHD